MVWPGEEDRVGATRWHCARGSSGSIERRPALARRQERARETDKHPLTSGDSPRSPAPALTRARSRPLESEAGGVEPGPSRVASTLQGRTGPVRSGPDERHACACGARDHRHHRRRPRFAPGRVESNRRHEDFVTEWKLRSGYTIVEAAHMELAEPSIGNVFDACVAADAALVSRDAPPRARVP